MSQRISIAMTTCNGAAYVIDQVESLLSQSAPAAEIIVCDDASDDETVSKLEAYEKQGLLRLYKNEHRQGVIANFKKAVGLCQPENFVALCDQDDVWVRHKLAANAEMLSKLNWREQPAIVFSDAAITDATLHTIAGSFWEVLNINPEYENLTSLMFGNFVTGCTVMMNQHMRTVFLEMPDKDVTMHDAWIGLAAFSFGAYSSINESLVQYRQHGGNVTYQPDRRTTLVKKIQQNVAQLRNNQQYLEKEIAMAKAFYLQYKRRLGTEQQHIFEAFIALGDASYWKKKKASVKARQYRYLK